MHFFVGPLDGSEVLTLLLQLVISLREIALGGFELACKFITASTEFGVSRGEPVALRSKIIVFEEHGQAHR